ncbi:hypothetical protein RHO15_06590 [Utexia brackfieldae]|uniref:hypothetical protein n=1 Tax=Utexia brackfieldae TaxID=3074108 RepID=UPI00370DC00C
MIDSVEYMDHDFSSLKKLKIFTKKQSENIFMHFFEIKKIYKLKQAVEFNELCDFLIDDIYLVMNNEPRYKGKKVFFTGNAVETNKKDLLDFISKPVNKYDLIIPLFIVPIKDNDYPDYMITTQEDPIFEIMAIK